MAEIFQVMGLEHCGVHGSTAVASSQVAVAGDTPAETLAAHRPRNGHRHDQRQDHGRAHHSSAQQKAGELVNFGGLLGSGPIIPANCFSSAGFIRRGGNIPALLQKPP